MQGTPQGAGVAAYPVGGTGRPRKSARVARLRPSRASGFSLIEVMVVVGLLSIVSLIAMPKVSGWRAGTRAREVAYEVLRMGRQAQGRALRGGVAWHLRYLATGAQDHGEMFHYRGTSTRCNRSNFSAQGAQLGTLRFNTNSVGQTVSVADTGRHVLQIDAYATAMVAGSPPVLQSEVNICYEPSGAVLTKAAMLDPAPFLPQADRITFQVTHTLGGASNLQGRQRRVVFHPGGQPRIYVGKLL